MFYLEPPGPLMNLNVSAKFLAMSSAIFSNPRSSAPGWNLFCSVSLLSLALSQNQRQVLPGSC
jgi:hypothetical protein